MFEYIIKYLNKKLKKKLFDAFRTERTFEVTCIAYLIEHGSLLSFNTDITTEQSCFCPTLKNENNCFKAGTIFIQS